MDKESDTDHIRKKVDRAFEEAESRRQHGPIKMTHNQVTWAWLAGVLVTIVLAMAGVAWAEMSSRVTELAREKEGLGKTLTRIEVRLDHAVNELTRINRRLGVDKYWSEER